MSSKCGRKDKKSVKERQQTVGKRKKRTGSNGSGRVTGGEVVMKDEILSRATWGRGRAGGQIGDEVGFESTWRIRSRQEKLQRQVRYDSWINYP